MVTSYASVSPDALFAFDSLLDDEELAIRDTTRSFVDRRIRPAVADSYSKGEIPAQELALELGDMRLLGMHLEGYGCAGLSAIAYGLACLELDAGDSGIRSLVSVQGSLAMYAIHTFGSEARRSEWLPRMATGEAIGCFGLTEPDFGSDPGGMRTSGQKDGDDWILNGTAMWITNGSIAQVAVVRARTEDGIRGFVVPSDTRGLTTRLIKQKLSLRASVTSELILSDVRLPGTAILPEAKGLSGPLACLSEARFGIVLGALGAARDCLLTALQYAGSRGQFGRPIAGFQLTQAKLADMALEYGKGMLLALHLGRLKDPGALTPQQLSLMKQQRSGSYHHCPRVPHHPRGEWHHAGVLRDAAREQPRVSPHLRRHERDAHSGHRPGAHWALCVPVSP